MTCIGVIQYLRERCSTPILFMIPTYHEEFILNAYDAGADEVIIAPTSFKLMITKVKTWARRSWIVPTPTLDHFQVGDLRLDTVHQRLINADGSPIHLTRLEFKLIHLLMRHMGQVLPSGVIIDRIWGIDGGDTSLLKNLVYRLRRKIEPDPAKPQYLLSIAGEGYMIVTSR